jgi:PKD repeat protein
MKKMLQRLIVFGALFVFQSAYAQCVKSTPYTEDFEGNNWVSQSNWNNSGSIPTCWTRLQTSNNYLWMAGPPSLTSLNSGPANDHSPGNGGGYAVAEGWFTGSITTNATVTHLVTPPIDLSSDTLPRLIYYYHMFGSDIDLLDVRVRKLGTNTWTQLHTINSTTAANQFTSSNSAWRKKVESLSSWAGDTIQIRFSAKRDAGVSWWTNSRVSIDDISVEETPSCDQPYSTTTSSVLATSAQINWGSLNTSPLGYQIQYKQGNTVPTGGTIISTTSKPASITGLNSNTTYSARVREICSVGDTSSWSNFTVFTTQCSFYTAPFTEDFEANSWDPSSNWSIQGDLDQCWLDQGSSTQFWTPGPPAFNWTQTGPSGDHTTGSGQYMHNQVTSTFVSGTNPRLISPWIDLDTLTDPQLSFWYHGYGISMGDFDVYLQPLGGSWTALWDTSGSTHGSQSAAWTEKILSLNSYAGDTVRIRFDYTNSNNSFYTQFAIDDVQIDRAPSCPKPSNTAVTGVGVMVAQLDWSSGGASNYQIKYREVGTSTWSWTTSNTSSVGIPMLSPQTTYEWVVRDSCGQGDVSDWVTGPRFTTNCTYYTAPFTETFSNSNKWVGPGWPDQNGDIDDCWQRSDSTDYFWTGGGTVAHYFNTGPSGDHTSGNGGYVFARSGTPFTSTADTDLKTPFIDLDTLQSPQLTFWYHMFGDQIDKLRVYIKPLSGTASLLTTISGQQQTSASANWQKATVNLAAFQGDTIQLVFRAMKTGTAATFRAAISLDDIKIDEPTTCPTPTLAANNITYNSADISWNGYAATSALEYGVTGYTLGNGTRVQATNQAYGLTGLQPGTSYTVWVKDTCTATLTSAWEDITFTTLPCPAITATGSVTVNGQSVQATNATVAPDSVLWYWGDGGSDTGATAQHTYGPIFGTFNIYQVVFNECGSSDSLLHSVDVCDTMSISTGYTVNGLSVTFNTTGSQGTGLSYAWDFGDGNSGTGSSSTNNYSSAGSYTIVCTATSYCGEVLTDTLIIEICAPVNLSFNETASGNNFSFSATPSNLVSYSWDFGDSFSGSGANVNHTYLSNGTYTVVLTATDSCGNQHTYSKDVATCTAPQGDFSFNIVSTGGNGMVVNFFATATDATAYHWYWGDGTNSKGNTPNAQHTYSVITLNYTVNLFLINDCGDSTLITHSLYEAGISDLGLNASIYPNPTQGLVNVVFEQSVTGTLRCYNAIGVQVYSNVMNQERTLQLDLTALPSGTYWLHFEGEESTWTQSIIKP